MGNNKRQPISFDPLIDEEPTLESSELDFEDDESVAQTGERLAPDDVARQLSPARARDAGLTGASHPGEDATADDMTPETLLPEDGARSPAEAGHGSPSDSTLRRVKAHEIGGGHGLDEAELGRRKPLDGKPWADDH